MFQKIKDLFNLDKVLKEKQELLDNLSSQIENKDQLVKDTIQEVKDSMQEEKEAYIATATLEAKIILENANHALKEKEDKTVHLANSILEYENRLEELTKEVSKQEKSAKRYKTEIIGIQNLVRKFPETIDHSQIEKELIIIEESLGHGVLEAIVQLNLHHQDSKLLRKEMNTNNKDIKSLLNVYQARYTTKANLTIYNLMVIGLQAELQNILFTLKYSNLEKALDNAKTLINKYLTICGNGNASILPTITKFLTELEPLFLNAVQIEYKYYIQKEKEKEEQRQIKEQIRQENEERRILEAEKKKIEKEEEKYTIEMTKNRELLFNEKDQTKIKALEARLLELENQFNQLEKEKEEIIKRANGRAGYVYIISNLGSFGNKMFKVGMTRRLNPQDRVDELGDASVPFKFDVHAMIFSNNAVSLEQKLHQMLESNRVNKINLRKEFFFTDIIQLQNLVQEIDSTVEFTTTLTALEYRQSESLKEDSNNF